MQGIVRVRFVLFQIMMYCGWAATALSQTAVNSHLALDRTVEPVQEVQVVTLAGNVHPLARGEFDVGVVSAETPLDRMILVLEPSAAQQAELDSLVEAQHDPESPLYHKWLTPEEYGSRFGASAGDLARVAAWLAGHGFVVEEIAASGRLVVFSGNAGMVADTFHTEIHRYMVNGVEHIGNAQDPQVPAALAGVVGGVVSLHDFRRTSEIKTRKELSSGFGARAQYTSGSTHYLFPADWATIYDLNSLYSAGTNGTGTSIAITGRSNINLSDVTEFRTSSGLTANKPTVILVNGNPGLVSGDQDESTLDVEWSGAVAPAATVKFVVGESTQTTDGIDLSAQYIVNHATAPVVSTSYGSCEQDMGATELAFYNSLWEQAASQGMSAFVSSGDAGASGCDVGSDASGSGRAVNGLCSSPYSTCVGGTEFNEGSKAAQYWNATNTASYESALSYIPEVAWNESASNGGNGLWASGGGASTVYSEPTWQKTVSGTSAANGMRAVPDVAMTAACHDGYIMYENGSFWAISGTSAASPTFAGVMALVVQSKSGTGQGNANAGLYPLVNASHNPFHVTPSGNNSVPGVTGFSASGGTYNLATGLGSVDGALLVSAWDGGTNAGPDFVLSPSVTSGTVLVGKTATLTLSAMESGAGKNAIALTAKAPTGVTVSFSPASMTPGTSSTVTIAVGSTVSAGTQAITLTGTDGSGTLNVTYSLTVALTPTLSLTAVAASTAVVQGGSDTVSLTAVTGGSFSGNITYSVTGLPTGVTAAWSANPMTTASGASTNKETLTLTAASGAKVASGNIVATAAGDGLVSSQSVTLQVQQAPGVTLAVSPASVQMQSLSTTALTVTATPLGGLAVNVSGASSEYARHSGGLGGLLSNVPVAAAGATGTGGAMISVTSGLPKGVTATFSAPSVAASGSIIWTLTLTGSASAVAGSSTLGVTAQLTAVNTGVVYPASANVPITVTLTPPALTVSTASAALSVVQGKTVSDAISVAGNGTYTGAVSLTVSGLPSGVTASWSSNPITLSSESGSSTLTLTASSSGAAGSATITVTAGGDGVSASKQITVQVVAAPSIAIGAASSTLTVVQGKTVTDAISLVGDATYSGAVSLSVSGLPSGVTASWSSNPVALNGESGSSTLTLTATSAANLESATITVTGSGDGLTASKQITVEVAPLPSIAISVASTTATVMQGKTVADAISLTSNATFSGAVSLSVSGLPSGVTASWSSNPMTLNGESGSSTLTLTASSVAPVSSATITVTASGDALTASKQITVQVAPAPSITIGAAFSSLTIVQGKTVSDTITLTGNATYSGAVSVSVTGLPSGVTASWSKNPVTLSAESGSTTLTLAASSAVTLELATITVMASGDGLTALKQISLQVTQAPGVQSTLGASTLSMVHTASGGVQVTVTPVGGLSAAMTLKVSGVPSGVTAAFSTASFAAPGSGSSTLTFTGSNSAKAGTTAVTVTVSGTSGAVSYSASQVLSLVLK
jgi:hypothetical protein